MKCAQARKLFGAYWDDEITQGEREWLDSHLIACDSCRVAYDEFAQAIDLVSSLPREEAAPGLVERALASARRMAPAPDRLPETGRQWVPVTAGAAAAVLVLTLVLPWVGLLPGNGPERRLATDSEPVPQPVAVAVTAEPGATAEVSQMDGEAAESASTEQVLAGAIDDLFDHSEDVEFILDPVALRRGRAIPLPSAPALENVQVEHAVITF
jgi:anti-sigma factor RsiW